MADVVPADQIEEIVGVVRHPTRHLGRAVSDEERVYILHSRECRDSTPDLRHCPYSRALDLGIDPSAWPLDTPVELSIRGARLVVECKARP